MGARQSMDDRPSPTARSNSVDGASTATERALHPHAALVASRGSSRSHQTLTATELFAQLREEFGVRGEDEDDDDEGNAAGPSRPPLHPSSRRSMGSTSSQHYPSRRRPQPHSTHAHHNRRSVPFFMIGQIDVTCPVCHKRVASDEADIHLVMCLTRPTITYNEDVLKEGKGECAICLDEMESGATIARLPCLCIYHKECIDDWFKRKNCCPEHPGDD